MKYREGEIINGWGRNKRAFLALTQILFILASGCCSILFLGLAVLTIVFGDHNLSPSDPGIVIVFEFFLYFGLAVIYAAMTLIANACDVEVGFMATTSVWFIAHVYFIGRFVFSPTLLVTSGSSLFFAGGNN